MYPTKLIELFQNEKYLGFKWLTISISLSLASFCFTPSAIAQEAESEAPTPPTMNWVEGPKEIKLGNNLATLKMGKDYIYANPKDTNALMEYYGNIPNDQSLGMVASSKDKSNWFVLFTYDPSGYVKDDDAGKIDADALMNDMKEGQKEANDYYKEHGLPPMDLVGWAEKPYYDKVNKRLIWSLIVESEGHKSVNYYTRMLGRHGVAAMNLVTSLEEVAQLKPVVQDLLANYKFEQGKTYGEFVPGKDKVAEYGLTAIIAGGLGAAAVKTGFFAKFILPLLLVLKKFWFLAIAAIAGLFEKIKSFFGGGKAEAMNEMAAESEDGNQEEGNEKNSEKH